MTSISSLSCMILLIMVLCIQILPVHSLKINSRVHLELIRKRVARPLSEIMVTMMLLSTPQFKISPTIAASAPAPTMTLEQSVQNLEKADTRADTLQALADVFETSGTKSLQARTKYKQRIITAINNQHIHLNNNWDQALGYASGEVKRRVDPYRTVDLQEYLKVAPIVGGVCYIGALFIQQVLPELFIFAYPFAVFTFVSPILFTLAFT